MLGDITSETGLLIQLLTVCDYVQVTSSPFLCVVLGDELLSYACMYSSIELHTMAKVLKHKYFFILKQIPCRFSKNAES